jgi:hypothetical protein
MLKTTLFAVGLVLTGAAMSSTDADAQACSGTCSGAERTCKATGTDPAGCNEARKVCMQTGVFTNPRTNRTFTNICKN